MIQNDFKMSLQLTAEEKKGDPMGKVARGLARLQVNVATADPILMAQAKRCAKILNFAIKKRGVVYQKRGVVYLKRGFLYLK